MKRLAGMLLAFAIAVSPAFAAAPDALARPIDRPVYLPPSPPLLVRPMARPTPELLVVATRSVSLPIVLRPAPRPGRATPVPAAAVRSQPSGVATSSSGAICGAEDIVGVSLSPIAGKLRGCGVESPVRVLAVAGVRLSRASTMDCTTAKALRDWVEKGAKPSVGRLGGGLEQLDVAAHYSCRTRNNQPGARISEHGKGRAIDISAVTLANGFTISVSSGWANEVQGQLLRKLHISACQEFKTVLGPDADRFHKDHFHFDTSRRGGRGVCR